MRRPGTRWTLTLLTALILATLLTVHQDGVERSAAAGVSTGPTARERAYQRAAKRDLLALMLAYPGHVRDLEKADGGAVYLVMNSGVKILYDDKREKAFGEKLAGADLQDMMEQPYPLGSINAVPEDGRDPGRMRNYAFFKEVYGGTESAVRGKLKSVTLGSGRFSFNGENGAADALQAAFSEVSKLLQRDPGVYGFVYPLGGTFNYRVIAGTGQLSAHAFAIAIDLKSDPCDYWRWATREQGQRRLDAYPQALVRVFEDNGFIWGGKWSHFDFLHYEYRPELLLKAKCAAQDAGVTWYSGFPATGEAMDCVRLIDRVLN